MAENAANKIDYIEFQARNVAASRKFFEQLFGWKFTNYGSDYTSFEDGRIAGGFSKADKCSTIDTRAERSSCFIIPDWKRCVSACSIWVERLRLIFFHFRAGGVFILPSRAETNAPFGQSK